MKLDLSRQQSEDLADLLRETPDRVLHDTTCSQIADEIEANLGMRRGPEPAGPDLFDGMEP
jgi:hypothetical protein